MAARRAMTGSTWGYLSMFLLGIVATIFGTLMLVSWFGAPIPSDLRIGMYQNSLTEFLPVISFDPGLPRAEVSFQKFQNESAGKAFLIAYPEKWNAGRVAEPGQRSRYWQQAVYMLKQPDSQRYLITYLKAPDFDANVFGYSLHTEFDPRTKEFFSVLDGRDYGGLASGIALFLLGFLDSFFFFLLLYDERHWDWDLSRKWRNSRMYRDIHYGKDG